MIQLQPQAQFQSQFNQVRAGAAEAPAHSEYVSRAVKFHQLLEVSRAGHCYCRLFFVWPNFPRGAVKWRGGVAARAFDACLKYQVERRRRPCLHTHYHTTTTHRIPARETL